MSSNYESVTGKATLQVSMYDGLKASFDPDRIWVVLRSGIAWFREQDYVIGSE
jgi:hypothetical protein